jgi:diacylglycerol kinase family enzyme
MRMMILLNKDGGTIRGMEPEEFGDHVASALAGSADHATVRLVHGPELIDTLNDAEADEDIGTIVAGGGDGTISAAAAACFRSNKILGVLPLGTMNLYARSIGLPMDPHEAVDALAAASPKPVDIGTVNGRPFIHQVSIGLHEQLVSLRSRLDTSTRFRKITSTLKVLGDVIKDPPRFPVETLIGDSKRQSVVSAVSVSNNLFGTSPVPFAPVIDAGVLGVYHAKAISSPRVFRMTLDAARGALMTNPYVDVESAASVTLRFPKKRRRKHAAIDGEIVDLEGELECICHAGGLRILAPATAGDDG